MNIGRRMKELRLASELTQEELAARTSLTKGFISLLEADKTSVSLDTLSHILTVLGETLSSFFAPEQVRMIVFPKSQRLLMEETPIKQLQLLVPGSTNSLMDPCLLTLAPNERFGPEEPHSGQAKRGDSFYYEARQEHFLANPGVSDALVLLVASPPQM
jgi:transcriptional regulator with XRE-family HTH domain